MGWSGSRIISNYVDDVEARLREALKYIEYLEKEILRLKMLLEGKDTIMNSFPTKKPWFPGIGTLKYKYKHGPVKDSTFIES